MRHAKKQGNVIHIQEKQKNSKNQATENLAQNTAKQLLYMYSKN